MIQQLVIVTALLAAVVSTSARLFDRETYEAKFFDHLTKFSVKIGSGAEFIKKLEVFSDNYDMIITHNKDTTQTYKLGK